MRPVVLFLLLSALAASAEEEDSQEEFDGDHPEPQVETTRQTKVNREKKAEGTPARDRFEAETVIKSRYGSLDVDPD